GVEGPCDDGEEEGAGATRQRRSAPRAVDHAARDARGGRVPEGRDDGGQRAVVRVRRRLGRTTARPHAAGGQRTGGTEERRADERPERPRPAGPQRRGPG